MPRPKIRILTFEEALSSGRLTAFCEKWARPEWYRDVLALPDDQRRATLKELYDDIIRVAVIRDAQD